MKKTVQMTENISFFAAVPYNSLLVSSLLGHDRDSPKLLKIYVSFRYMSEDCPLRPSFDTLLRKLFWNMPETVKIIMKGKIKLFS